MRARSACVGVLAIAWVLAAGCSLDRVELGGGRRVDAGRADGGGIDGGDLDAGELDAGELDGGMPDGGDLDGGELDAGDGGELDAGDAADLDGGEPDAGPDASMPCVIGELSCLGDDLVECDASGALVVIETCALGCVGTVAPAHCGSLRATHVDDPDRLFDGTADLVVAAGENVRIDTGTGRIVETTTGTELRAAGAAGDASGLVLVNVPQAAGFPELAILSARTVRVDAGGTLLANGSRALIVLASGAITIDGVIDVGGRDRVAGPGGGAGGDARGAGGGPGGGGRGNLAGAFDVLQSGGGGGGHSAAGGSGGDDAFVDRAEGGAGGAIIADPDGSPLVGGGGGGAGADAGSGGDGGGGGGALQLTSAVSVTISSTAAVRAPGAGGGPGEEAGGGGGAGGTIFLEAPLVEVAGGVFANGGGGGGADTAAFSDASPGTRGRSDTIRAAGGDGAGAGAGDGGSGGAGTLLGGEDGSNGNGGGGGGGAAGRIRVRSDHGPASGGGTFSPSDPSAMSAGMIDVY